MKTVLVIDDDADFRTLLRRMLERMSLKVVDVGSGSDCAGRYGENEASLAMIDIFMPEMDGLDAIRELRLSHPGARIVAMSAGGSAGNLDLLHVARQFGADAVLVKPFDQEMLETSVRKALGE